MIMATLFIRSVHLFNVSLHRIIVVDFMKLQLHYGIHEKCLCYEDQLKTNDHTC